MAERNKKANETKTQKEQRVPVTRRRDETGGMPLRDAISRLFDESFLPFGEFPSVFESAGTMYPKVDVSEKKTKLTVTANVPGVNPDDVDIEVDEDYLTLSGEVEKESEEGTPASAEASAGEEDEKVYHYEREYGSFHRTIPLPARVRPDQVTAKTKDGVLTIDLPKQKEERARKVKVKPE